MIDIHYGDEFDKLGEEWGSGTPKLLRHEPSMKVLPKIDAQNIDDSWGNEWDSPPTVLPQKGKKNRNEDIIVIQPTPQKAPPVTKKEAVQKRPLLANTLDDFDDLDMSQHSEAIEITPKQNDGLLKKQKKTKTRLPNFEKDLDDFMNDSKPTRADNHTEQLQQRKNSHPQKMLTPIPLAEDSKYFPRRHSDEPKATASREEMSLQKANAVSAHGCNDFTTVLFEAYKLLFGGELINGISANY